LPGTNTLAYLLAASVEKKKSFITLTLGQLKKKFFTDAIYKSASTLPLSKPFQAITIFVSKSRAYPSKAALCRVLALFTNVIIH
jgi:hypothetical protein